MTSQQAARLSGGKENKESDQHAAGRRGLPEWAALGGVAYVALFIIGIFFMFDGGPDTSGPPEKVIAYFSDSGSRNWVSFGWMLAGVGLLCFLFFVASLRQTVSRFDRGGILGTLTALGGGIYAALALIPPTVSLVHGFPP